MAYLVFARKYRPQVFEEVIGQDQVTRTLQNAIRAGRVAHALLFAGPRGVGKTSAARILAKALNCKTGPTPVPCGKCDSCQEISSGVSMDVIEIDGASNRGINEIRELREKVKYAPARGRYKIFIIDEVHMLTPEAFNALLKTLEEPPGHVVFVFATTEPNKIPLTILSRCQRFDFKRIPLKGMMERLEEIAEREGVGISAKGLQLIARQAEGSMRDAQSLLDQVVSFAGNEIRDEDVAEVLGIVDRKLLYRVSLAIANQDGRGCLEVLNSLDQYGYDFRQFSRDLLNHLRNLMIVHIAENPENLLDLPGSEINELKGQAEGLELRRLQQCFDLLLQVDGDLSRSPFPKLILETALLKMVDMEPVVAVDELLKRLEALEDRLTGTRTAPGERPGEAGREGLGAGREAEALPESDGTKRAEGDGEGRGASALSEDLEKTWKGFLASANGENPVLGALLSHGRLLALNDRVMEIGFRKGSFYYDQVQEEPNRRAVAELTRAYFNRDLQPVFSIMGEASRASSRRKRDREADRERRMRREVLESPIVKDALEILEGEVEEVKVDTSSEP
ncbi:MAG: DNA polymerase III subunit gamma/tau [Deltaproteobacteria bacterium]|nr:DNA polymerase III subunit gamma/tau [Deltaproteobacteria bacterium]